RQLKLLKLYAAMVLEKNRELNLTRADTGDIWKRHIADSLACVPVLRELLSQKASPLVADSGAGAGYLGICIKIAWPETRVHLWESNRRKFQFIIWAVSRLGLRGINPVWGRVGEKKISEPEKADAVVERAMGKLKNVLEPCLGLAKEDGGIFMPYQVSPVTDMPHSAKSTEFFGGCSRETGLTATLSEEKNRPSCGDTVSLDAVLKRMETQLERTVKYVLPGEQRERMILVFRRYKNRALRK
ncbi:MAG: RsmG family class I SAM-dependent methyltransferase, partial [bacterium]